MVNQVAFLERSLCDLSKNVYLYTCFPVQYGLFLKHYGMGGAIMPPPLVTLVFLKVEGQNLEAWGILMCFLQKWY